MASTAKGKKGQNPATQLSSPPAQTEANAADLLSYYKQRIGIVLRLCINSLVYAKPYARATLQMSLRLRGKTF